MHKRTETQIQVMCKGKSEEYVVEVKRIVEKMIKYASLAGGSIIDREHVAYIMVELDRRFEIE